MASEILDGRISKIKEYIDVAKEWEPNTDIQNNLPLSFRRFISSLPQNKSNNHDLQLTAAITRTYDAATGQFLINDHVGLSVGLQDIWYITGLPINGNPVIGVQYAPTEYMTNEKYLGIEVDEKFMKENDITESIRLDLLRYLCTTRIMTVGQQVRGYLLYLIGCFIYPCQSKVPLFFLTCLEDIKEVDKYAWGATLLASMRNGFRNYTSLFKGKDTDPTSPHELTAPCHLVVIFMLEDIQPLREFIYRKVRKEEHDFPLPKRLPLMKEWSSILGEFYKSHTNRETMEVYAKILKNVTADKVCWQPYKRPLCDPPQDYKYQLKVITSNAVVMCLNRLAYSEPNLKQFGLEPKEVLKPVTNIDFTKAVEKLCGTRSYPYDWTKKKRVYSLAVNNWTARPQEWVEEIEVHVEEKHNENMDNFSGLYCEKIVYKRRKKNPIFSEEENNLIKAFMAYNISRDNAIHLVNKSKSEVKLMHKQEQLVQNTKKKKLAIFDLNGVLLSDAEPRQHCIEYLESVQQNFDVAIWSSKQMNNIVAALKDVMARITFRLYGINLSVIYMNFPTNAIAVP